MKAASANRAAHLAAGAGSEAWLWRITRRDGTVLRFTSHDASLSVDGADWAPLGGGTPGNLRQSDRLRAEGLDVAIVLDSAALTEADLVAGRYDHALLGVFSVDWQNPADGTTAHLRGRLGEVEWAEGEARAEFQSLAQFAEATVGELYQADCNVDLGSTKCGVDLEPPEWQAATAYEATAAGDAKIGDRVKSSDPADRVWFRCTRAGTSGALEPSWNTTPGAETDEGGSPPGPAWEAFAAWAMPGTVTAATDERDFADSSLVEADGTWDRGVVTWLTGDNAGVVMEVERYLQAGGTVRLRLDLPFPVQVGDTYRITKGCDKSADCAAVFDNLLNRRAFGDLLPGLAAILRTPDAR